LIRTISLRIIAALTFFFGLAIIGVGYSNAAGTAPEKPDLSFCFWMGPIVIALGVSSFLLCRWALVLLAISCVVGAIALAIGTIARVPFPWELINLFVAALLLGPAVVVVNFLRSRETRR
jgi:hypothetical protein